MLVPRKHKLPATACRTRLASIFRCSAGLTAMVTAIMVPIVIGFAALAVDLSYYQYLKLRLEATTDTTALQLAAQASATQTFSVRSASIESLTAEIPTAIAMGVKNLPAYNANGAIALADITVGEWDFKTGAFNDIPPFKLVNAVKVTGELSVARRNEPPQFFSQLIGRDTTISTTSYAYVPPVPNIHTLDRAAPRSFSLTGNSDVDSIDAWVNSSAPSAVFLNTVNFSAWGGAGVFTPGGVVLRGRAGGLANRMTDNMFVLGDLLAETDDPDFVSCTQVRTSEAFSSCKTFRNHVVDELGAVELEPGVYRGGLEIRNASSVTLKPGIYVMAGGPLTTSGSVAITGEDVMIYFNGRNARMQHRGGQLKLRGLEDGPYQGFVIYGDRETTASETHVVGAPLDFVGTIYLPTGNLAITSGVNGSCHSLCVVSQNFRVSNAFLNIYPGVTVPGFGKVTDFPPPLSLIPALLPVLTLENTG